MAEIEHLKKAAETLAATHMDIRTREPADDIGWFAREMAAVLKELETVRAERDALRAALEPFAAVYPELPAKRRARVVWAVNDEEITLEDFKRAHELVNAALDTQPPQAEWTPRIDDKVRTAWSGAICTVVNTCDNRSLIVSESGIEGWINNSDLAPVDESEAQAEWTPRKPNDAAFLRPGHYVRVKATGERLRIDRVSLNSDASDGKAWAGDWFRADALEPTD